MKNFLLTLFLALSSLFVMAQLDPNEQLAIQYYKDGEYEKAAELLSKIYNNKNDSYIYYYYYQVLLELGDNNELEKIVKRQIKKFPNVVRYQVDLGYVYERSNEIVKAEKEYQNILKNLEPKENAVRELYNAFLSKAKREYAIETVLRGRKILANNKLFSKELTNIYEQLNLTDKIIEEAVSLIKEDDATYLNEAQSIIQNLLLNDEDHQKYLNVKTTFQKNIQKEPDNICYLQMLYWVYQLNKDYASALILAKSLDKRFKEEGDRVYTLALLAANNRDYDTAIEALNYIISKGESSSIFFNAKIALLDVKYRKLISSSPVKPADAVNLEHEYKKVIDENGIHAGTSDWVHKYAHLLAFYVNKPEEAIEVLTKAIASSERDLREKSLYKTDMADIMLYSGNIWDATLLYSQVEKDLPNDTIGHIAKFKNAKLSFYIGEFAWAESQLDVLRAATSKLIANDAMYFSLLISENLDEQEEPEEDTTLFADNTGNLPLKCYAKADFLLFQNKEDEAFAMFDSVLVLSPFGTLVDDALYQKSLILIKRGDYFGAEILLKQIVELHSSELLADDAVFKLAELYEYYLKDIPTAMEYYQKILRDYSGSLYVTEARKHYRALRGDYIN